MQIKTRPVFLDTFKPIAFMLSTEMTVNLVNGKKKQILIKPLHVWNSQINDMIMWESSIWNSKLFGIPLSMFYNPGPLSVGKYLTAINMKIMENSEAYTMMKPNNINWLLHFARNHFSLKRNPVQMCEQSRLSCDNICCILISINQ